MKGTPKDEHHRLLDALDMERRAAKDLRWWRSKLEGAVIVLVLGAGALTVGLYAERNGTLGQVKQAYERGLTEGTTLKNDELHKAYLAGYSAPHGTPVAVAPGGRGPLDLTKFTAAQIKGLRCYIQDARLP
jgi:hypothetical protein